MKRIDETEFQRQVIEALINGDADIQTDNEGQLIIYTGVYEQADTTLGDEPDPKFNCSHETTYINDRMQQVCSQCGAELGR